MRAPSEGRRWIEQLLGLPEAGTQPRTLAIALFGAAGCAVVQGEGNAAAAYWEAAAARFRALEDLPWLSRTLAFLGAYLPAGEAARAQTLLEEALALARATGERYDLAFAEFYAGLSHWWHGGDLTVARTHLEEALRFARALDADWLTFNTLICLANMAWWHQGRQADARRLWQEGRPLAEAFGDRHAVEMATVGLARLASVDGDQAQAATEWSRALVLARELGNTLFTAQSLAGMADVLAHCGRAERAARLLAVSDRTSSDEQYEWERERRQIAEPALAATQAALSAEAFARAWEAGPALSLEQATAEALALANEVRVGTTAPNQVEQTNPVKFPDSLTAREVEVLRLIATGHSSREIAAALVISEATVTRHVTNLYGKIGAKSRADATAYAFRHRLAPEPAV